MSLMIGIPTVSKRKNWAATACSSYAKEHNCVIVADQGQGEVLDGYEEGSSWVRTSHDNLLAQIRTLCDLAKMEGATYLCLLDDDVTYLAPLAEDDGSYRIKSKADVSGEGNWHTEITHQALDFIAENVESFFEDENRSMVQIATRLFFPKPGREVPYVTPRGLDRFPTVFNDHVIWRVDRLDEVLQVFADLGVLNYSAGVDKSAALVNNILGYTVGKMEWVRATKRDITGNGDSTIYDFGDMSETDRNLHRNTEDAKALIKIKPFVDKSGLYYWATLSRAGMLNHFVRTPKKFTLEEMIEDFTQRAIEKNAARNRKETEETEETEEPEAEETEEPEAEEPEAEEPRRGANRLIVEATVELLEKAVSHKDLTYVEAALILLRRS